jgi:hypothetical protein
MRGFKEHDAADRFCREHDELRNFLRSRSRHDQCVPATRRRPSLPPSRSHRDWHHAERMTTTIRAGFSPLRNGARHDRTMCVSASVSDAGSWAMPRAKKWRRLRHRQV